MAADTIQRFKIIWLHVKIAGYFLVPAILLFLPPDTFDEGAPKCVSVIVLGIECYACGMTRAMMYLIHFDFIMAWYFNPLAFFVFPLLAYLWAYWFYKDFKVWRAWRKARKSA